MTKFLPSLLENLDSRFAIGLDDYFKRMVEQHQSLMKNTTTWPPYNIKKTSDTKYEIQLACAGFSKEDLSIEVKQGSLIISGSVIAKDTDVYIFKGIADRSFTRSFVLDDNVRVLGSTLKDGMLYVFLDRVTPTSDTKKIEIS